MDAAVAAIGYWILLVAGLASSQPFRRPREPGSSVIRAVPATFASLVVVAIPSLVQLTVAPGLLPALQRDWPEIANGQVWRLVTAIVVQDGGWPGALFNLGALAVIGSVAELVWGTRRWLVIALVSGVGAELWGWVVQPVGGGNSVVVFGLAASLAVVALLRGMDGERMVGALGLLAGTVLLVIGDLHGGAAAIGAVVAVVLLLRHAPLLHR